MAMEKIEVSDLDSADLCLLKIAKASREIKKLEIQRDEKIETAVLEVKEEILRHSEQIEQCEMALGDFGHANKDLFENPRSHKLKFGTIGFKKTPVVKPLSKWTWKKVLIAILKKKLKSGFSIKHSINKRILTTWSDAKLKEIGVKKTSEDNFSYSLKEEGIAE